MITKSPMLEPWLDDSLFGLVLHSHVAAAAGYVDQPLLLILFELYNGDSNAQGLILIPVATWSTNE